MGATIQDRELWVRRLMFVAIAVVYLAFPTKSYFFDGIAFAQIIEELPALHPSLFHPNHLIYNVVGSLFYHLLVFLDITLRAVAALQILNAILSCAAAYVLFQILTSVLRSRYLIYALTLLFAFTSTWWKFSTDADAYIPSVLFLLISFYLVLPDRGPRPFLTGLTYAVALCFHQIAIVAFPMLVVASLVQDISLPRTKRIIQAVMFAATAGAVTLSAYTYSFYRLTGTVQIKNLVRWMISYAPDESFGFHAWNNLVFTLRGHVRLFFGGRLNASKGLLGPFLIGLLVLLAVLLVIFLYRVVRNPGKPDWEWLSSLRQDSFRRRVASLCLLWVFVYLIFLYFLLAHHTFYRLFYLPALIVLVGLGLDSYDSKNSLSRKYRLALFVAIVFLINFVTSIYPYSHVEKYPPLVLALELNGAWPQGSIIYYGRPNSDASLVRYFNPGMTWKQLDANPSQTIQRDIEAVRARGVGVWLETTAIDRLASNPETAAWLDKHKSQTSLHAVISKAHNIRFIQVVPVK